MNKETREFWLTIVGVICMTAGVLGFFAVLAVLGMYSK